MYGLICARHWENCAISELGATIMADPVDLIYTHMYIILMWPESKIDTKERVSEVFPAIKIMNDS
jgi:hypothetical protein